MSTWKLWASTAAVLIALAIILPTIVNILPAWASVTIAVPIAIALVIAERIIARKQQQR